MQGPRALGFTMVAILIFAAFMIGRSSVRPSETSGPTELSHAELPQKLSAITRVAPGRSGHPDRRGASTGTRQTSRPPVGQIETDLETVAEFLSAAANEPGDLRALIPTIAAWMDHDPDEAIDWLASGDRRDEVIRMLFEAWGRQSPSAALAWLKANRESDRYQHAAFGLAGHLASEDALQLAETLNDPSRRAAIWTEAGVALYANDQDAALERLDAAEFPDQLEHLTIRSWKQGLSNISKRNAQNLASVYSSARAAGAEFGGGSAAEVAHELVTGIQGGGQFNTTRFQVPNMSERELDFALQHLSFEDDSGLLNDAPSSEEDL